MENKDEQVQEKPETSRQKRNYFFPNGGEVPANSVMAADLEEAEKLNNQFVKENQ